MILKIVKRILIGALVVCTAPIWALGLFLFFVGYLTYDFFEKNQGW